MADDPKTPDDPESAGAEAAPEDAAVQPAAVQPAASQPAAPAAAGAKPAAAAKPAPKPAAKPAAPTMPPAVAGKTTSVAARRPAPAAAAKPAARAPDDSSPLLSRRAWMGIAWGAFSAASAAALAATGRFMFPNVLNEPPQQFTVGIPTEYGLGVDERWKDTYGIWLVRTAEDVVQRAPGFYALITVCTHLGCTPNYLPSESKFKCPCHGSGFRLTGINFEGPAPRPLERCGISLAEDGQILIDKSRHFQQELGQWTDPASFLRA